MCILFCFSNFSYNVYFWGMIAIDGIHKCWKFWKRIYCPSDISIIFSLWWYSFYFILPVFFIMAIIIIFLKFGKTLWNTKSGQVWIPFLKICSFMYDKYLEGKKKISFLFLKFFTQWNSHSFLRQAIASI